MHLTNMDFQIFLGEESQTPMGLDAFAARDLFQELRPPPLSKNPVSGPEIHPSLAGFWWKND